MPAGARPTGPGQPMFTRADAPDPSETFAGKVALLQKGVPIKRRLGSVEGGLEVGMATMPFNALRSVAPKQSWRDSLDKMADRSISPSLGEDMERGGGDPNSTAFKAAAIAPTFLAASIAQGGAISLLGSALRGGSAAAATRTGYSGFKAMDNVLNAQRATRLGRVAQEFVPGAAVSAGVTAATTGANDENLFFGKGRMGAVAEDLSMSAIPAGFSAASHLLKRGAARLNIDNAKPAVRNVMQDFEQGGFGIPPERRLPARTGISGEMPPIEGDPNGRTLITPPPAEVSPNAMPVLTDQEAMQRLNILRKRGDSFRKAMGVNIRGERVDQTKQAVADFNSGIADAQNNAANRRAAEQQSILESEQAARDAVDPRKMSTSDLLRYAGKEGLKYGAIGAASYNADNIREMMGQERKNDSQTDNIFGGTIAGLALAGTLKRGGKREAFNSYSRLERAMSDLPDGEIRAADLLKKMSGMNISKMEADKRGFTQWLETAKATGGKVTKADIQAHLDKNPLPVPLARQSRIEQDLSGLSDAGRRTLSGLKDIEAFKKESVDRIRYHMEGDIDDVKNALSDAESGRFDPDLDPRVRSMLDDYRSELSSRNREVMQQGASEADRQEISRIYSDPRRDDSAAGYTSYVSPGKTLGYNETILRTTDIPTEVEGSGVRSGHFAADEDYGAHIRTTDRRTVDGDDVLNGEEWQSDNYQQLRDLPRNQKRAADLLDREGKLQDELEGEIADAGGEINNPLASRRYKSARDVTTEMRETVNGAIYDRDLSSLSPLELKALERQKVGKERMGIPATAYRELQAEELAANEKALGGKSALRETWTMASLKTMLDEAARGNKKYLTLNSGADIFPVVAVNKKAMEKIDNAIVTAEQLLAEKPTLANQAKLDELRGEKARYQRMSGGMDRAYGDDVNSLISKWEKEHGRKLNVTTVKLQPNDSPEMMSRLVALRQRLDAYRATDKHSPHEIEMLEKDIFDLETKMDPNPREVRAIEIDDDLRRMIVDGEGQSRWSTAAAPIGLAGAGAAGDEDLSDEQRGFGAGAAVLALGSTGGRGKQAARIAAEIARRARMKAGKLQAGDLPNSTPTPFRAASQRGAAGFGNMNPNGPVDTRDFLNFDARWQELKNDPTGKLALEQRTAKLLQERGANFRETVTFDDVRQQATRLGMEPEAIIQAAKKRGLSPAEQLAATDVVAQNMDNLVEYEKRMADPSVTDTEKQSIQRALAGLEAQTNELLWANLTERTEAGRNLVFQKIAANRTMDPQFWMARAAKNIGNIEKLSIDNMSMINSFIAKKDRAGLASYVAGLKPGRIQRILTTAYKAGLLTNPATHATNIASNVLMAGAETAKDAPAAVADRMLTSMLNSALGGSGVSVKRSRDFSLDAAEASWKGAKEGIKEVKATMKGQDTPTASQLGKYDQVEEIRTSSPLANAYLNGPFRMLRASDNVFREAAFFKALEQQRRLAGMPKAKNITDAVASASGDMVSRAVADAEVATFQNSSMLGNIGSKVKQSMAESGGAAGRVAGEFILPFTKTPGAVASSVVRYSPLGLMRGASNMVELALGATKAKIKAGELAGMSAAGATPSEIRFSQEQLKGQVLLLQELKNAAVDRVGRGTVGTAIMGLGAIMAMNGMLTVKPGRSDRAARDTGETTGDPGNTIDFGPLNGQIDRLSPLGNLLLLGAYAVKGYNEKNPAQVLSELEGNTRRTPDEELKYRALKQQRQEEGPRLIEGTWGTAVASTLGAIGNTIIEQPVFSGVKRVEDVLADPVKATQRAMYSQAASVIPSGVAAVARTFDSKRRETETLGETLTSRVPGASKTVPAKLDALGTPIEESFGVRVANLISPIRLSTDRTSGNSTDAQVRKILADLDIPLSRVNTRVKDGETGNQARSRQAVVGENIMKRVAAIIPTIEQLPQEQRADYLKLQIGRARSAGNRLAKRDRRSALFADLDNIFDGNP